MAGSLTTSLGATISERALRPPTLRNWSSAVRHLTILGLSYPSTNVIHRKAGPTVKLPFIGTCNNFIRPMRHATLSDCQSFHRGGSLLTDMQRNADWARIVVAIFTMAMFYASVCSTTCAIGFCPNQVQQTAGHDCDQTPSHHSHQSGHQAPANPDCSQHQHPGPFLAKSGDLAQFRLSVASHLNVSAATISARHDLVLSMTDAEASDHASPPRLDSPHYQQISVLRI